MIKTLVKIQKENFVREERYVHNIEDDSWLESGYEHNKTKTVVCTHDEFIESLKNKNELVMTIYQDNIIRFIPPENVKTNENLFKLDLKYILDN